MMYREVEESLRFQMVAEQTSGEDAGRENNAREDVVSSASTTATSTIRPTSEMEMDGQQQQQQDISNVEKDKNNMCGNGGDKDGEDSPNQNMDEKDTADVTHVVSSLEASGTSTGDANSAAAAAAAAVVTQESDTTSPSELLSSAGPAPSAEKKGSNWTCSKCTLINEEPEGLVCEACNQIRYGATDNAPAMNAQGQAAAVGQDDESNDDLDNPGPPVDFGEAILLLLPASWSGKERPSEELDWEPYDPYYHQIYSHDFRIDKENTFGCVVGRIRQGEDNERLRTRWRVVEGRSSRKKRRQKETTFAEEQGIEDLVKAEAKRMKSSPSSAKKKAMKKKRKPVKVQKASTSDPIATTPTKRSRNQDNQEDSSTQHDLTLHIDAADSDDKSPTSNARTDTSPKQHYLEERLGMTKDEILSSLPEAVRDEIHNCCWVPWKESKNGSKKRPFPALILSPFDLAGKSPVLDDWANMFERATNENTSTSTSDWKALVYWYTSGWSKSATNQKNFKAFNLVDRDIIVDFYEGMNLKYDKPEHIVAKIEEGGRISQKEDAFLDGIDLMIDDFSREKGGRGGPMFFDHLRKEYFEDARQFGEGREKKRRTKCIERALNRDARHYSGVVNGKGDDNMYSLELCSGEARMSNALRHKDFEAFTLDNSQEKASDSSLSLEQLDTRIENGSIQGHPFLDRTFDFIWAGPECRTWSRAASTKRYRSEMFIYGFHNKPSQEEALQAEDDIESLTYILLDYKARNPDVLICIENPDCYLPKHPVSKWFAAQLGLTMVRISYCFFGSKHMPQPQKNTVLWTNSKSLISAFGDGKYSCKGNCGLMKDGKHLVGVQDMADRCAAYPSELCGLIAQMIATDVKQIKWEKSKASKKGEGASRSSSRHGSATSSHSDDGSTAA